MNDDNDFKRKPIRGSRLKNITTVSPPPKKKYVPPVIVSEVTESIDDIKKTISPGTTKNYWAWIGGVMISILSVAVGMMSVYQIGYSNGEKEERKSQPKVIARLEDDLKRSNEINIDLQSEFNVSNAKLEMTEHSLAKAQELTEAASESTVLEDVNNLPIQGPLSQEIKEGNSFTFYEALTVSVVEIDFTKDLIHHISIKLSALKNEPIAYTELTVGDTRTFPLEDTTYEILISAVSTSSVDVTVNRY
ncbi:MULTISPECIES: hypothetical protein [unclassified Sporosarcina]|uniref:hypothetical protein n=1 Tax=unclassified Sporosarcina TaxID=2647733 RepID=UPI001A939D69|nr:MULTISPECIES: hypothetical protein [unclassified Sporosarcina]MBO0588360.1 hypothetical protein [Sporosarcina sp. E16_8]MBO0603631.1 hypothetical protein [Sporosarcina sp. E16_3]